MKWPEEAISNSDLMADGSGHKPAWFARLGHPKFDHWAKSAFWSLDEITALYIGVDPYLFQWTEVMQWISLNDRLQRCDLLRRSAMKTLISKGELNSPKEVIDWAQNNGFAFPEPLQSLVNHAAPYRADEDDWLPIHGSRKGSIYRMLLSIIVDKYGIDPITERIVGINRLVASVASVKFGEEAKPSGISEDTIKRILSDAVEFTDLQHSMVQEALRKQKTSSAKE